MKIYKNILRWIRFTLIFFFSSTILSVVILKWLPVYYTPLMAIRCFEQWNTGREVKCEHEWVDMPSISTHMPTAVIAAEDAHFLEHSGFDFKEIYKARLEAIEGGRERGASTISQQTAKNVFLWPGHSWVRKGLEAYFTVLIENIWGKERIMEVYLNSIETGDGIYGVQAVSKAHFKTRASLLNRNQAALIAASLPNPVTKYDSAHPNAKLKKRQAFVLKEMRHVPAHEWQQ